jgi:hypothetical protein
LINIKKTLESLRIEIIDPKAKRLLQNLTDLELIRTTKNRVKSEFSELLLKLRNQSESVPSLEEITEEVEAVRKARYEK